MNVSRTIACLVLGGMLVSPAIPQKSPRFRTEVDQVVIYAAVYDQANQLYSGLTKDDFTIYEDKIEQEITYFGQEDIPSTVGLVIDASGSMRNRMSLVIDAVRLFLEQNHPENELFLIKFDDEAELEEDFTRDVHDIGDALENIIASGGTALYDAIYLAVDKAREGNEPRKVVIVFTDGEDKDSYYQHEELLDKIRESEVQVFVVAFLDPDLKDDSSFFGIFRSEKEKIQKKITVVAEETGGKTFFPEKLSELGPAFQSIAEELRRQYRLAYVSSNTAADGKWREVDVRVRDAATRGLKVRAKKGYYAEQDSPAEAGPTSE